MRNILVIIFLLGVLNLAKSQSNPISNQELIGFEYIIAHENYFEAYFKVSVPPKLLEDGLSLFIGNRKKYDFSNDSVLFKRVDNEFFFSIQLEKEEIKNDRVKLFVSNEQAKTLLEHDVYFPTNEELEIPSFSIFDNINDIPIIHNYASSKNQLVIKSDEANKSVFAFHYEREFGWAKPPMTTSFSANEGISVDEVLELKPGEPFSLKKEGTYLFQKDTATLRARSLVVKNGNYPEPSKIEHLVESFRYLLKEEEYNRINNSDDLKKSFDKLILDISFSKNSAKELIKNYFFRVKLANLFFTTYKEGWKTDMGMIFIIFGNPDVIDKSQNQIVWTYFNVPGERNLKFTFDRVESIFSKNHYSLKRKRSYAQPWFRLVELWREGRIR